MKRISIQRATGVHADGILDCLRAAFAQYEMTYSDAAFTDTVLTRQALLRRLADMTVLVAVDCAGSVSGTIAYKVSGDGEGHLRGMAVLPQCQGYGIADQLLERAEADLMAANCSRISLDTTEPLERAIRFYERHGYRRSGKIQDFFGMPLIEYVKSLKQAP